MLVLLRTSLIIQVEQIVSQEFSNHQQIFSNSECDIDRPNKTTLSCPLKILLSFVEIPSSFYLTIERKELNIHLFLCNVPRKTVYSVSFHLKLIIYHPLPTFSSLNIKSDCKLSLPCQNIKTFSFSSF